MDDVATAIHQAGLADAVDAGARKERRRVVKLIRTYFEDSREYERSLGQDLVRRILEPLT